MTWFKVDDGFYDHPKVIEAGTAAAGLWVRTGSWASKHETDGFIPKKVARTYGTPGMAKALVGSGLWTEVEGGYQFHQWSDEGRQPTRSQRDAERIAARTRMRKLRGKQGDLDTGGSNKDAGQGDLGPSGSEDVRANSDRSSGGVRRPRPVPSRPETLTDSLIAIVCRRLSGDARATTTDDEVSIWREAAGGADLETELKAWLIHNAETDLRDPGAALLGWLRKAAVRASEARTAAGVDPEADIRPPVGCGASECVGGWISDDPDSGRPRRCLSCRPALRTVAS